MFPVQDCVAMEVVNEMDTGVALAIVASVATNLKPL
jgi:hypothetical protein